MKFKRLLVCSIMIIAVLACAPQVSQSTLVIPSSLKYMANKADTIINGTIRSSYGYREKNMIYTGVKVDVHEYIKSSDPTTPPIIELKVMGGEAEGQRLEIDRAPRFYPGDEVLLFLIRKKDKYLVYGIYYGACRVVTAADGVSKQVVGPVFSERKVQDLATKKVHMNTLPSEGEKLELFVQRVKDLIDRR